MTPGLASLLGGRLYHKTRFPRTCDWSSRLFSFLLWEILLKNQTVTWNSVDVLKPAPFVLWGQVLPVLQPPSEHSIWTQTDTIKQRYTSKSISSDSLKPIFHNCHVFIMKSELDDEFQSPRRLWRVLRLKVRATVNPDNRVGSARADSTDVGQIC